jgi:hypothetical protein
MANRFHLTLASLLLTSHAYNSALYASPPDSPLSLSDEESAVVSAVAAPRRQIVIEGAAPAEDPLLQLPAYAVPEPQDFQPLPPPRLLPPVETPYISPVALGLRGFFERNTLLIDFPELEEGEKDGKGRDPVLHRQIGDIESPDTDDEEEIEQAPVAEDWIQVSLTNQPNVRVEDVDDEEDWDDDEAWVEAPGDGWLLIANPRHLLFNGGESEEFTQHLQVLMESWKEAGGKGTRLPGTPGALRQKIGRGLVSFTWGVGCLVIPFVVTKGSYKLISAGFTYVKPKALEFIGEMAKNPAAVSASSRLSWVTNLSVVKRTIDAITLRIVTNGASSEIDKVEGLVKNYQGPILNVVVTGGSAVCTVTVTLFSCLGSLIK